MNRTILFANEYNSGKGNVLPFVRASRDPDIQALGSVRLLLSKPLPEYMGVECDLLDAPELENPIDINCYEDLIHNTAMGLAFNVTLSEIQKRMSYLRKNKITHVILRDSPLMAIAARIVGVENIIFYQNSMSIPSRDETKRKLSDSEASSESLALITDRINKILKTLGRPVVEDVVNTIFKSKYNFADDYPVLDQYRLFNHAASRDDVEYVGMLPSKDYAPVTKGKVRAVVYLDESQDFVYNVVQQIMAAPYNCEVVVFNTPQTKIKSWEQDGVTFIGDGYQPLEPYVTGSALFVCNGGSALILKSLRAGCLPLVINPTHSRLLTQLTSFGLVHSSLSSMGVAECFSVPAREMYYERILNFLRVELQVLRDPITALVAAIEEES